MDLFEYQGKQLFAAAGIPVVRSWMIHPYGPDPLEVADSFGLPLVAKAQVLSGGRGKAGAIRTARTRDDLARDVSELMAMTVRERRVVGVLLEEAVNIERELYLAIAVDRAARRPLLMFSVRGGVDIEAVARDEPGALKRLHIDPLTGLGDEQLGELVSWAGFTGALAQQFPELVRNVWTLFCAQDATLVEINPLCVTRGGDLLALDAKVTLDGNAAFRHPEWAEFESDADERELRARAAGINYVSLDGDIGVVGNGAGMVMSTLDLIAEAGGRAADFLDVGGGAREAQIAAALDLVLSDERVRALLVTIFGGITRCDEVAQALVNVLGGVVDGADPTVGVAKTDNTARDGARAGRRSLPVVVRLDGTRAAEGRAIVRGAGLRGVTTAATSWDAVQAVAAAAAGTVEPT